jgi:transposase
MEGMGPTNHTRKKAEALQARRDHATRLFADGLPQAEIARRVGVTPGAVCRWHRIWKRKGAEGLRVQGRWGPPPQLTEARGRRLEAALLEGAQAHGHGTDLWTLPRIAELIHSLFGIRFHPAHVWKVLRDLGWSVQRPTTRARERNEEAIARWSRKEWPRLKKTAGPAER